MFKTSNDYYPQKGGPVGPRKPRRDYWGNIFDKDRYIENEEFVNNENYDYSDYDVDDDNDSYYSESSYD